MELFSRYRAAIYHHRGFGTMKQRQQSIFRHLQARQHLLRLITANGTLQSAHQASDRQGGTEPRATTPRQQHPPRQISTPSPAHKGHRTTSAGKTASISQAEIEQMILAAIAQGSAHDALVALIAAQIQEQQRLATLFTTLPGSYQRQGGF